MVLDFLLLLLLVILGLQVWLGWIWRRRTRELDTMRDQLVQLELIVRELVAARVAQESTTPQKISTPQAVAISSPRALWDPENKDWTKLQAEVLQLARTGLTVEQIAKRFGLGLADTELILRLHQQQRS
ncbi:MAG: DUF2802 domain-containing protein [Acidithiobacillus sp.]|nr:DUF2802 domain-containing protein [Acidithiobacillus sp.]